MIYILGDLHIRKEEPFFSAASRVLEEMKTYLKPGDILVQVGDLFHTSKPYPKEYKLATDFLSWCKKSEVRVILLAGNHDYNFNQKTYSIDPFYPSFAGIVYEPTLLSLEGTSFFFLPWMPEKQFKESIEDEFPNLFKKEIEEADYLVYHFPDETIMFGSDFQGIDLSAYEKINPKIKRIGGDIHKPGPNYVGTPYQTRYDEKGQAGRIAKIEKGVLEYIELPIFTDYVDIEYGDSFLQNDDSIPILTIKNAPSVEAAKEKYGDYFIRLVETENSIERVEAEEKELLSLNGALQDFLTINKVSEKTSKYLLGVMNI